jgi:PAS domain S-box-containing protein
MTWSCIFMERRPATLNTYHGDELSVTLFEECGDALFLFDPDTEQLLDVNPMAQRLSGFGRSELLRLRITYLLRSEIQGGLQRLRHAYQKTGVFHSQEGFLLRHHREGLWIPVNLTVTRLHAEPKTLGVVTARDVREQRDIYVQLRNTEQEFRRVLSSVSDAVWSADVDRSGKLTYLYFSPVVEQITGRPPEFYLPGLERWLSILHPEDRPRLLQSLARIKANLSTHEEEEYRVVLPDATERWVRDSVQVSPGAEPQALRLDGVVTDVTSRKQAESALRASEVRFRTLVEKSSETINLVDADGIIRYASESTPRMVGYSPDELVGLPALEYVHPEDRPRIRDRFARCLAAPGRDFTAEFRYRHKDGSWRHLEGIANNRLNEPGVGAIVTICRDITKRKQAEQELAHERDLLRILMENIPHFIYFKDDRSCFTRINRAQANNIGLAGPEEATGKTDFDYYPLPLAREFFADEQRILQTGEPLIDKIERQTGDDSNERWLSSTKVPIIGEDGRITGLVGVSRDVTQQQRAEAAVRASEAKYRALIDNLDQGIFLKDCELRFVAVNRYLCLRAGKSEAEIVGKTDHDFYPPEVAAKHQTDDRLVLAEGRRLEFEEENSLTGQPRTVRVIKTPVKDDQGRVVGVLGITWDVTEQRALEAQLRQAQKMEAVGQLAGGVAHDFNNLLTVILGNVSMLQSEIAAESRGRELLAATEKAALRAAELTSKLLGFSRRTTLRLEPATFNTSIDETVALLRRTFDPRITLVVNKAPDPWLVQADPGQINQVLMNLCLNARDAMPNGGYLVLETENLVLGEDAVRLHLEARPGEFVRLSVSDTGEGIPPNILPHIFEPFFTTKAPGKGTGLGLAMVFGIVNQHHGWIECASRVNGGTCFDIYLPRWVRPPDGRPSTADDAPLPHGHETILLADDEPMIRNLARIILQSYGYQVLLAEDGLKAVEIYQREAHRIDLVILDLTMPRLSGRDAFRRLLQIDPAARVLFASGYAAEHVMELEQGTFQGFVAKPYRPDDLARTVRITLDRLGPRRARP